MNDLLRAAEAFWESYHDGDCQAIFRTHDALETAIAEYKAEISGQKAIFEERRATAKQIGYVYPCSQNVISKYQLFDIDRNFIIAAPTGMEAAIIRDALNAYYGFGPDGKDVLDG